MLDVFVRGKHNDELVHRFWDGPSGADGSTSAATWPRRRRSPPAVPTPWTCSSAASTITSWCTDSSTAGKWSGWINLGGDLAAGPAVTAGGPHVLDVFVRGKHNDELVHRFCEGKKWSGWINLGRRPGLGDRRSPPVVPTCWTCSCAASTITSWCTASLTVASGADGSTSGGDLARPAVTAGGPHGLDVFVRGKHNDELVHRFWSGTKWSGWINLGGDLA